jgi:hypothetical protein
MPRGHSEAVEVWPYSLFNLGTRRRWVVIATTRPLYPAVKRRPTRFTTVGCLASGAVSMGTGNID